jgi:TctA family transporter
VKNISDLIPTEYSLQQNYPNPFNPSTTIRYSLPQSGQVKLIVYDVLGRQVATLIDEKQNAGVFAITFNAARLTSGVYFYRLNIGTFTQTKKMLMLK